MIPWNKMKIYKNWLIPDKFSFENETALYVKGKDLHG